MLRYSSIFLTLFFAVSCEGQGEMMLRPILYGTSIALVLVSFYIIAWMYEMNYEKDPLIYSKFLSVRKNK